MVMATVMATIAILILTTMVIMDIRIDTNTVTGTIIIDVGKKKRTETPMGHNSSPLAKSSI